MVLPHIAGLLDLRGLLDGAADVVGGLGRLGWCCGAVVENGGSLDLGVDVVDQELVLRLTRQEVLLDELLLRTIALLQVAKFVPDLLVGLRVVLRLLLLSQLFQSGGHVFTHRELCLRFDARSDGRGLGRVAILLLLVRHDKNVLLVLGNEWVLGGTDIGHSRFGLLVLDFGQVHLRWFLQVAERLPVEGNVGGLLLLGRLQEFCLIRKAHSLNLQLRQVPCLSLDLYSIFLALLLVVQVGAQNARNIFVLGAQHHALRVPSWLEA